MGKGEENTLPTTTSHSSQSTTNQAHNCCSCCTKFTRLLNFRCVFVLVLGLSVLLSAVFWLPPFFSHGDRKDLDLDSKYKGHDIVATFIVQKPLSLLHDDFPQLGGDIFDEIRVPNTKVVILTAERGPNSNASKVIFGVDPDENNSKISSYAKSLVRDSFVSLVLKQSPLRLTESLFGEPSSFEVLKFVGGITVTPHQSAYPLQKVQIRFNFTLNFSVEQILDHFDELTSQLKSGLHLAPYENLHVSLTNPKGSTVGPPTTVQSSVVLVVGSPSNARSKQLAQTIKGSPTKNLGLNHTQFGNVKQISLLSLFNSSSGGTTTTPTPSPAPLPNPPPPPHQNEHRSHHHRHHDKELPPVKPPSPSKHSPAPRKSPYAKPPGCHPGYDRKKKKKANTPPPLFPPVSQPIPAPRNHPPPPPRQKTPPPPPPPRLSTPPPPPPRLLPPPPPPSPLSPPPPPPPVPDTIPASSPLPSVVFAHTQPPSKGDSDADPPDIAPSGQVLQPSSAVAVAVCAGVPLRAISVFLVVITVHLLQAN